MMTREGIISVGRAQDFAPADYVYVAKGDTAVCVLEQTKLKELADLITYFEGFARGLEEARDEKR